MFKGLHRQASLFGLVAHDTPMPTLKGLDLTRIEIAAFDLIVARVKGSWRQPAKTRRLHVQRLHHQWLENLMLAGHGVLAPKLPIECAAHDQAFKSALADSLNSNGPQLGQIMTWMRDLRQIELIVTVESAVLARQLADKGVLRHLDGQPANMVADGIARAMNNRCQEIKARLQTVLEPRLLAHLTHPPASEEIILHAHLLCEPAQEAAIDQALERVDVEFDGLLQMRLIGPLPAIHFAPLSMQWWPAATLQAALEFLHIEPAEDRLSEARITAAFRQAARRMHPDHAGALDDHSSVDQAIAARDMLMAYVSHDGRLPVRSWVQLEVALVDELAHHLSAIGNDDAEVEAVDRREFEEAFG